jgi:hypothetical protein
VSVAHLLGSLKLKTGRTARAVGDPSKRGSLDSSRAVPWQSIPRRGLRCVARTVGPLTCGVEACCAVVDPWAFLL